MFKTETYGLYQTLLSHNITTKLKKKERESVAHKLNNLSSDKQLPLLFIACENIKASEEDIDMLLCLEQYGITQDGNNVVIDFDCIPDDLQNMFSRFSLLSNE